MGDPLDHVEDTAHRLGVADERDLRPPFVAWCRGHRPAVVAARAPGSFNELLQVPCVKWLRHEVEGAGAHSLDTIANGALGRQHDDGRPRLAFAGAAQNLEPVGPRHHEIREDDLERLGELVDRGLAILGLDDHVPGSREQRAQQ